MTTALTKTFLPGHPEGSMGVEAMWEIGEVVLNDRRHPDFYLVESIEGIFDADVRDAREPNPSRDGEFVYRALHGGKPLTLEGRIYAGNLNKLRNMQDALAAQFMELEETPVYVRAGAAGYRDSFYTLDPSIWQNDSPSALFTSNPGFLTLNNGGAEHRLVNSGSRGEKLADCDVIMHARMGSGTADQRRPGIVLKWINTNNYLKVNYEQGLIELSVLDNGSTTFFGDSGTDWNFFIPPFGEFWLRGRIAGNVLTGEVSDRPILPHDPIGDRSFSVDIGAHSAEFGTGISANYGFMMKSADPFNLDEKVLDVYASPRNSRDLVLMCRKTAPIGMPERQENLRFTRAFMLPLRSSWSGFMSAVPTELTLSSITLAEYGRINKKSSPVDYPVLIDTTGKPLTFLAGTAADNNGKRATPPTLRFYGPMTNPGIVNSMTGDLFALDATIDKGDYYEVDISRNRIRDSRGNNVFGAWDRNTQWIHLPRGRSQLVPFAAAKDTGSKVVVMWRHAY